MENLTIKQLLDLGAKVEINFYGVETEEDAQEKFKSLDYEGERYIHHSVFDDTEMKRLIGKYNDNLTVTAVYDFKYRERE